MIIDRTFFTGPLLIAQLGDPVVQSDVDNYISMYEPELLAKALGESLYTAFNEALSALGSDEELDARWASLLDGASYTDKRGNKRQWVGFAPAAKRGPIAAYVLFHYLRDTAQQPAGVGTVQARADNAAILSPIARQVTAWNAMAQDIRMLWQYLVANQSDYPELVKTEPDMHLAQNINAFGI